MKGNQYSMSNVDWPVVEAFNNLSSDDDYINFVRTHLLKLLPNWSFFLTTNNHNDFLPLTKQLSVLVEFIVQHQAEIIEVDSKPIVDEFFNTFINDYLKTVYKCLTLNKNNLSIYMFTILKNIVNYNNELVINNLLNSFDFNLPVLPKLVMSRSKYVRQNFIRFYLSLISRVSSFTKKNLLMNFKIMNGIWKSIEYDDFEMWLFIFDFITQQVLHDSNFKKSTRCKILNENFLQKFSLILNKIENPIFDKLVKDSYYNLFNLLVADEKYGLIYPQNQNTGVDLSINNRSFKINNKIIYTLLTFLKPWESYNHLTVTINILRASNELIAPYTNWIVANGGGYHDPSLTSWWIGHTLLFNHILSIENLTVNDEFEVISLPPLSKSSLMKCIESKKHLIVQLSLQLIFLQLKQLIENKTVTLSTIELVVNNLPPLSSFYSLINIENKISKLTVLQIINYLEILKPSQNSSLSSLINKEININLNYENNYNLILLNNYLSIQSSNADFKWFNKSNSNTNSFFTNLIKLSSLPNLKAKVHKILLKLVSSNIIFNSTTLIDSPISALVESSNLIESDPIILNLLDETISRSIKFPYKYLDLSHEKYNDVSIFLVALCEQLGFVTNRSQQLEAWLLKLCQYLIIIGEPKEAVVTLFGKDPLPSDSEMLKTKGQPRNKIDFGVQLIKLSLSSNDEEIIEIFTNLGSFIIGNLSLHHYITTAKFWGRFFDIDGKLNQHDVLIIGLINELFKQIDLLKGSTDFRTFIFDRLQHNEQKNSRVLDGFIWVLSNEQLLVLSKHYDSENLVQIYEEIHERKIDITPDFAKLIDLEGFSDILIHYDNIPLSLIQTNLLKYQYLIDHVDQEALSDLKDVEDENLLYLLGSVNQQFLDANIDKIKPIALSLKDWNKSLQIFNMKFDSFDSEEVQKKLFEIAASNKLKLTFTSNFARLMTKLNSHSSQVDEWFQKSMLYVTKKLAESSYPLSSNFKDYLSSLGDLIQQMKVAIPTSFINAQLEVIVSNKYLVLDLEVLKYASSIIGFKSIDYVKFLQIFVNNDENILYKLPSEGNKLLRIESSIIIEKLFLLNPKKNSTEIMLGKILNFYLGSTRADDVVLKSILKTIEKNISKTWISRVSDWDFSNEISNDELELVGDQPRLIIHDKNTVVVSINRNFILNSIKFFNVTDSELMSYEYNDTIYDTEFLLLLIINNKELFREQTDDENTLKVKINLKQLIDSSILQYLIINLANKDANIVSIVKILINGMLKSIEQNQDFKDVNIFKVYLSNILNTLRRPQSNYCIIWYNYSALMFILINPGHYLYDKVCRYVLSNPVINDIPLYKEIVMPMIEDDTTESIHDQYYRQVNWLIHNLTYGAKTSEDIQIIKSRKIIEWVMNLFNSKYNNISTKQAILKFIYVVQEISQEGSDALITRFSMLSNLEIIKQSLRGASLLSEDDELLALNVDEIIVRFSLILGNNKRIVDWTGDDLRNVVKRICV